MKKYDVMYVVDDDDTYQFIAQRTIAATGCVEKVQSFLNGQKAIDCLKITLNQPELLPDIILLDLTMPVLDGWGFLEEYNLLKNTLSKKPRIFVVTSSINPVDLERSKTIRDVTDYIVKPVTEEKFSEMISGL